MRVKHWQHRGIVLIALTAVVLGAAVVGWNSVAQAAEPAAQAPGVLVEVTVTAVGRNGQPPPEVTREDVMVFQGRERREVVGWVPVQPGAASRELVILIDDTLDPALGLQLGDLREFIGGLPAGTRVAVAYANNGTVRFVQDFTADREQAAKSLRLPMGTPGAFSSVNLSLSELAKRWPREESRRAVLLVSHGIDVFRGVRESSPNLNPDLRSAIGQLQRAGVNVFTLYARGTGRIARNTFLIANGQSSLARLAYETGGESFFSGLDTPVAFKPFLGELQTLLRQQYVLTFRAQPREKAGYERLRVTTEVPGVELMAPDRVYVPAQP